MAVNLTGVWHGIRAALPYLRASGRGSVVKVAGTAAGRPTRGEGPYAAAKAGVVALTRTAALGYAPEVRVNAVSPGYVATRMTAAVLDDPKLRARIESRIPLGRIGDVEEVAGAVAFLCSVDAGFVTGHDLVIDGGSLLPSHQSDELLVIGAPRARSAADSVRRTRGAVKGSVPGPRRIRLWGRVRIIQRSDTRVAASQGDVQWGPVDSFASEQAGY